MKHLKRGLALLIVTGVVSMGVLQDVQACDKTSGCSASGEKSTCGYVRGEQGYHQVTESNGYTSYCTITVVSGPHTITCAGCDAVLRTEYRKCSETHSNPHCESHNYMCK